MTPEFREQIEYLLGAPVPDWQAKIMDAIRAEYEFRCQSFVYAGPGHQSRHECTWHRPHPIEGEHGDDMYEWVGTSSFEPLDEACLVCKGSGQLRDRPCHVCAGFGKRRKLINVPHGPCYCGSLR